jgi:hypothetical protein
MKTTIRISMLALSALLLAFAPAKTNHLSPGNKTNITKKTEISWKKTEIGLGDIAQSKPVTIEFEFTNTGETPVMISNVQASCGCTSTNYAKTPVLPGESTKISAVYNAAAKGVFKKIVNVTTNAEESPKVLVFSGVVI